jgi:hypothetical protein
MSAHAQGASKREFKPSCGIEARPTHQATAQIGNFDSAARGRGHACAGGHVDPYCATGFTAYNGGSSQGCPAQVDNAAIDSLGPALGIKINLAPA